METVSKAIDAYAYVLRNAPGDSVKYRQALEAAIAADMAEITAERDILKAKVDSLRKQIDWLDGIRS